MGAQSSIDNYLNRNIVIKFLGVPKFLALQDISFLMTNKDEKFLQNNSPILQQYNKNIMITGAVGFLGSIATNLFLQKQLITRLSPPSFLLFLLDIAWYGTASYLFLNKITQPFQNKQSQLWKIKDTLIKDRNTHYLKHLRLNCNKYRISLQKQVRGHTINQNQIPLLLLEIQDLDNQKNIINIS